MKKLLFTIATIVCVQGSVFAEIVSEYPSQGMPEPFLNANKTAFLTTTSFSVLSIVAAMRAAATAEVGTTWNLVSYSVLAVTSAAVSLSAITAWVGFGDKRATTDAGTYLEKVAEHTAFGIAGAAQFFALTLTNAIIQGVAQGTSKRISRAIAGPDQTIQIVPK
ncbi:membrane hypothetical protein [Gammaproteobacteria bacterium]